MSDADKKQQFLNGLKEIEAEARRKLEQLRANIGDQDGDGDVDLHDVQVRILKATNGWSWRDSKVLGAGLALGYLLAKAVMLFAKLAV